MLAKEILAVAFVLANVFLSTVVAVVFLVLYKQDPKKNKLNLLVSGIWFLIVLLNLIRLALDLLRIVLY